MQRMYIQGFELHRGFGTSLPWARGSTSLSAFSSMRPWCGGALVKQATITFLETPYGFLQLSFDNSLVPIWVLLEEEEVREQPLGCLNVTECPALAVLPWDVVTYEGR